MRRHVAEPGDTGGSVGGVGVDNRCQLNLSIPVSRDRFGCARTEAGSSLEVGRSFFSEKPHAPNDVPKTQSNYQVDHISWQTKYSRCNCLPISVVPAEIYMSPCHDPGDAVAKSQEGHTWSCSWCPSGWSRFPNQRASAARYMGQSRR